LRGENSYLAHGKTLAGREYTLSSEEQAKVLKFFDSIAEKNKKVLIEAVTSMIPVLNQQKQLEDGRTVFISRILPQGLLTDADAKVIAGLAKELLTLEDPKAAPVVIGTKTFVPRFLTMNERSSLTILFSGKAMSFDMEVAKAGLRGEILAGIQDAIHEVDATWDFGHPKSDDARSSTAKRLQRRRELVGV
jgi:hypothetical protein